MNIVEKLKSKSCCLAAELIKSAYTQGAQKKLAYDPADCILGFTIAATEITRNRGNTGMEQTKKLMHEAVDLACILIEAAVEEAEAHHQPTGIGLILNLTGE